MTKKENGQLNPERFLADSEVAKPTDDEQEKSEAAPMDDYVREGLEVDGDGAVSMYICPPKQGNLADSRIEMERVEEVDEELDQMEISPALDPWALPEIAMDDTTPWSELTVKEKIRLVVTGYCAKLVAILALLYVFICSLGLLSDSFRLLGGRAAGQVFKDSTLLQNPICGLMIGVLATVLLQSSSTSTSIVVSMVASQILPVRSAIPIVMGANIGTSMTNTLVSVAHSNHRAEFRRAFAGATVHDMFNWLCVIILLPLECACGYLFLITDWIVNLLDIKESKDVEPPKLLSVLTAPLNKLIVQLDKSKIRAVATNKISDDEEFSLIKRWCDKKSPLISENITDIINGTSLTFLGGNGTNVEVTHHTPCRHIFAQTTLADTYVGLILLCVSLLALVCVLICIVKVLHSMLKGQIAFVIRNTINNDLPGCFSPLTGYLTIVVGAIMTILVQSSSVFTSALTPLVGIGVLSLERMYPLTLGANVGTTFTSVLAALAADPSTIRSSLQIAFCHLLFNVSGILLFFVVPWTRKIPVYLAKQLGNKTAKYRWFAVIYILLMFFLLPGAIFGLSMAGNNVLLGVAIPFVVILCAVVLINILQAQCPKCLPQTLRSWKFLPKWMHSLQPADQALDKIIQGLLVMTTFMHGECHSAIKSFVACPFCTSGWTCCFEEPDTTAKDPRISIRASESRKQLLLKSYPGTATPSPASSKAPSRMHSRSNSPTRIARIQRNNRREMTVKANNTSL